ncbi:MAG: hypothetical protein PHF93_08665 [Acidobacteriota bacterium]|nr:hypothetical protein [Acidobacteriota bacterium]OQB58214.1 MAG: hypothetical protein BWX98_00855 [Candidatus Aminicenantes bacterium ADurb.Bin147]HOF83545.1 hypothetical protein [Candidatus Aminicenantes bacterium]MDD8033877.1 hypothetical protein [Acidobacteriota bacterium]HOS11911.1 hypothetical protein [Candidatus Aminicenantes bacterium]
MPPEYAPKTIRFMEAAYAAQGVLRPLRRQRYEPGTVLEYELRGVWPAARARVSLEILKFAGGGFAGQVYQVAARSIVPIEDQVEGLEAGRTYALKILIPPSRFAARVRNFFYGFGFQAPFSLQSLAAAGRSQALWQKFIRRAARVEFGRDDAVADVIGTFRDERLGSYGELGEWVDGRMWRFEIDDDLDSRHRWKPGDPEDGIGSPEYRTKREFMKRLTAMMRRMGAEELARQYEWGSLKSQPNAMKRIASDPDPRAGLTAVDFRAGMALTPLNPQCPVDFKLILRGLGRGRLVQFDKGDLRKLERFAGEHAGDFADLRPALEELKREDAAYRDSLVDWTHHHVRLFSGRLRRRIMAGFRESWRVRNITDDRTASVLAKSGVLSLLFLGAPGLALASPLLFVFAWPGRIWWKYPLWLLPLILTPLVRKIWGRDDFRRHCGRMLTSPRYILRAGRARIAEAMIRWVRTGRASEERARNISSAPWRYYAQLPFSLLPPGFHRFLTEKAYFKERIRALFIQPARLLVRPAERERWMIGMIDQGGKNGLLTAPEVERIKAQVKEPYIQKYLKSLAVHAATLFVSETVFLVAAVVYVLAHPELTWQAATLRAGLIIGALNLLPVSPGSLVRGFYVVGLMIKERNFKDYNIALGVSFLKVFGYLAFPIQMTYRYPDLARFMAGHWANEAVHRVPVFGEKGAWLEHFVFDAFYNFPLTLRRRIRTRAERRAGEPKKSWTTPLLALAAAVVLGGLGAGFAAVAGGAPSFNRTWGLAVWVPVLAGAAIARAASGFQIGARVLRGMTGGALLGAFAGLASHIAALAPFFGAAAAAENVPPVLAAAKSGVTLMLLFGVLGLGGALFAETRRP